ncbi:amidohydrolase [Desmospora profundinema]|uniref:Imidazolonepropionase-like amidohydrolase n=1 Tax=Desmospora profundinema TaxID=1571184 RepID=A0ABU1IN21_9BACL|nr:amidohydrolase [Desmospora profundinema]MDR6226190.1 imidazolonepropionase-like amidohydrolase [Desmospora profundinema]
MIFIQHAEIRTIANGTLQHASILLQDGKIKEIGSDLEPLAGAQVINGAGKVVTPGLIDVHTHLGIFEEAVGPAGVDVNELTNPATPHLRALDAINPHEQGFIDAVQAGVTTVQVMPGSGNVIGGEMVVLKTHGSVVDEMVLLSPSGLKIAFGENPKRVYGGKDKLPSTRMGIAAVLRENLVKAQNYRNKWEKAPADPEKLPERDLKMEILVKVLKREIPVRAHAHRADDIATALRIAEEFQFELTIEHCTEGHKIPQWISSKGVRVAVGPTMSNRSKIELGDKGWHTLTALADYDVPFSITTDHPVVPIETLITAAAYAVADGLDEELAWEAITLNAAKHLQVEDRVGSLEAGKDADVVIWNGDPLDFRTKVETTIIDGKVVYQR